MKKCYVCKKRKVEVVLNDKTGRGVCRKCLHDSIDERYSGLAEALTNKLNK